MTLRLFIDNPYSVRMRCLHLFACACGLLALAFCGEEELFAFFLIALAGHLAGVIRLVSAGGRKSAVVVAALHAAWSGLSAACVLVAMSCPLFVPCGVFAGGASAGYAMALPLWYAMDIVEEERQP